MIFFYNKFDSIQFVLRFFVESKFDPEWTVVTIIQAIYLMNCMLLYTATESTGPFLDLFACAYLKIVQKRFKQLGQFQNSLSFSDVRECIILHQKTLQ